MRPQRNFNIVAMTVAALSLAVCCAYVFSQPEDRYGMDEESWREFQKQAEQFGVTPAELKAFIDRELGTPLLFDRKHKVGVR